MQERLKGKLSKERFVIQNGQYETPIQHILYKCLLAETEFKPQTVCEIRSGAAGVSRLGRFGYKSCQPATVPESYQYQ